MLRPVDAPGPWISFEEVALRLGCHPTTARRMARDGTIPSYRSGGHLLVHRAEFERWLAEGRTDDQLLARLDRLCELLERYIQDESDLMVVRKPRR